MLSGAEHWALYGIFAGIIIVAEILIHIQKGEDKHPVLEAIRNLALLGGILNLFWMMS